MLLTDSNGKNTVEYSLVFEKFGPTVLRQNKGIIFFFFGKWVNRLKVSLEDASVWNRICGDRQWGNS